MKDLVFGFEGEALFPQTIVLVDKFVGLSEKVQLAAELLHLSNGLVRFFDFLLHFCNFFLRFKFERSHLFFHAQEGLAHFLEHRVLAAAKHVNFSLLGGAKFGKMT